MQSALAFLMSHPGIATLAVLVLASGLWRAWEFGIRPRLLSQAEISRIADDLAARHGARAEEIARMEEHRAWCYADGYSQGVWRRVVMELRRR